MSQLTTERGREFQAVGAAQLKDRLPMSVRLKTTSRSGATDDSRVPLHDALVGRASVVHYVSKNVS